LVVVVGVDEVERRRVMVAIKPLRFAFERERAAGAERGVEGKVVNVGHVK
jgi:hypothetical protein